LPCYSTAAVGDSTIPGIQATAEKMLTLIDISQSGAQYIHYAFGLLERTNVFCPEQAIIDDAHIGIVKQSLLSQSDDSICEERRENVLSVVREVMETDHKTYMYHLPLPTRESVYVRYPLEDEVNGALYAAHKEFRKIEKSPRNPLPGKLQKELLSKIPGILPQALKL
jgi:trimethylamine--corrinoid protein Co-methyltransferase